METPKHPTFNDAKISIIDQVKKALENERNEMINSIEWNIEYHKKQLEKYQLQLQVIKQNSVN